MGRIHAGKRNKIEEAALGTTLSSNSRAPCLSLFDPVYLPLAFILSYAWVLFWQPDEV